MIPGLQNARELGKVAQNEELRFHVDDEIDSDAEELLHMMLEKDPADRATITQMKEHPFFDRV